MSRMWSRSRRVSTRSRWLLAGTVCGVALVTFESVAFACSNVMGPLSFSTSSGPAGTVVYTSATGLKAYPARYDLFFGGECMTFTGTLLKTITTNRMGAWTNVKVTVPVSSAPGTYALCGVEAYPMKGMTATTHNTWTVT